MTNPRLQRRQLRARHPISDIGMSHPIKRRCNAHVGFSLIELLIALSISAALMTATLAALDASFQQYKSTTESASTHVVSRIAMHRMLSMIRTGIEFGPYPADVYSNAQNPVVSDFIEFVSQRDLATGQNRITRIEFRPGADPDGPGELWYILIDSTPIANESDDDIGDDGVVDLDDDDAGIDDDVDIDSTILDQRLLIPGVQNVTFTLRYNRQTYALELATIDMTIAPNDSQDLRVGSVADPAAPQTIRLVASAAPRQRR